jgi:hypothetical protein
MSKWSTRRGCAPTFAACLGLAFTGLGSAAGAAQGSGGGSGSFSSNNAGSADEAHFRADLDPRQFGYEFDGITMMYQQTQGLLREHGAGARAQTAFDSLVDRSRRTPRLL